MELSLFSNFAPFFIALAILVALKLKLWRKVDRVSWLQRICGLMLPPLIIFSLLLLYILLGRVDAESMGITIVILMFYLAFNTLIFAAIALLTKAKSFIILVVIAFGTNLFYLIGQYFSSDNPNQAINLLDFELISVLILNIVIFAGSYWAYIKNWSGFEIPTKIDGNE